MDKTPEHKYLQWATDADSSRKVKEDYIKI